MSVRRSLQKRLSKAALCDNFCIDDDFWSCTTSDSEKSLGSPQCQTFELCDQSVSEYSEQRDDGIEKMFSFSNIKSLLDSAEDEEDELEGMYSFDQEKIAAILQQALSSNAINQEELEDLIAESMQESFLTRVRPSSLVLGDLDHGESSMPGTLSARMTPGRGTPETGSPKMTPTASPRMTPRSGVGQLNFTSSCKDLTGMSPLILSNKRLSLALESACASHKQELEAAGSSLKEQLAKSPSRWAEDSDSKDMAELVGLETSRLYKQRRRSLLQAAQVIGMAAVQDEDSAHGGQSPDAGLAERLNMVHQAVEGARRKHRASIAKAIAMQGLEEKAASPTVLSLRERLDRLAAAWVQREEARRKQTAEQPKSRHALEGKKYHQGYLALLKTRTSMLGRRPPNRCSSRKGSKRK